MPKNRSTKPTAPDDSIALILESWRLWLLGALIGALLAWGAYIVFPPDYRARATVVVDNNLEEAWQYFPDKQLLQFLQRETERLQELVWSDEIMQAVASASNGVSVEKLRDGMLKLSQPADGGWHFYADSPDSAMAQTLASTWAQTFVDAARAAVNASPEMEQARQDLHTALQSTPTPSEAELQPLLQRIASLAEQTKGIDPFVELYVSQERDLPVERSISQGTYLLVGSIIGALVVPLWLVLRPRTVRKR